MSDINNRSSQESLDFSWPNDASLDVHQSDRVVFENVPDQYVRGHDVTVFFTILQDTKVNPEVDQIGLLRVGTNNLKGCLLYAPVEFTPSTASGAFCHGTATFPSAALPATDDEFYQFCYILDKSKSIGTSIPFQLNCEPDEIDLLSNGPVRKMKADGLIALADQDHDDLVVIHTKNGLIEEKLRQENRHLSDLNRRLDLQTEEIQAKLEIVETKHQDQINKANNEIQTLTAARKAANEEILSRQQTEVKLRIEYDSCRSLCDQYQSENVQNLERCRTLEANQVKLTQEANQVRNQWAAQSQFTQEQATQIVDLERRLVDADTTLKTSNQRQSTLERELRDSRLTAEKQQLTMQSQVEEFQRQNEQRNDQINALESKNQILKDELISAQTDNECLALESRQNKDLIQELQEQLDRAEEQNQQKNEALQNEIALLRRKLHDKQSNTDAYNILKASCDEISKRCVKYRKGEVDGKRQIAGYQKFIEDLERQIQDLTERLSAGADEYRVLFRKYTKLEQSLAFDREPINAEPIITIDDDVVEKKEEECIVPKVCDNDHQDLEDVLDAVLRNTHHDERNAHDKNEEEQPPVRHLPMEASFIQQDSEVRQCPVCSFDFPDNLNIEGKNRHIESHFQ